MIVVGLIIFFILVLLSEGYSAGGVVFLAIIVGGIYFISQSITNNKVENKNPLDVDNSKMTRDICNGVSQSEIRRRYGNGYYDKNR